MEYLKLAGHEVDHAADGESCLEFFNRGGYDMVILDILVPKVSGIEVLKKIRACDTGVGVIMMSVLGDEKTQLDAFSLWTDDYIIKPISPLLLLKRIETIWRRRAPVADMHTGFTVDEGAYSVYENGVRVPLTLTEFLIVNALYREPNRVFTRDALMTLVYGPSYFGVDRVIDAHIKNIRKKMAEDRIRTVIGVGYAWKE